MSEQCEPLSENQREAAFFSLAHELGLPANTISWISYAITTLSLRKSSSVRHSNAREVCSALLRDLNEFYSGDIEAGLKNVEISCSEDVGRVVWGLVSKQVIQANPEDNVSQFNGLFRIDDLENFLTSEGIKRASFSWIKCKQHVSWIFYILGVIAVVSSYADLVSHQIAWIGWIIGMVGFLLSYLPDPEIKRY